MQCFLIRKKIDKLSTILIRFPLINHQLQLVANKPTTLNHNRFNGYLHFSAHISQSNANNLLGQ